MSHIGSPYGVRSELPPLGLSINVDTPSGQSHRLGPDDRLAENIDTQLTISSTLPGGFEQCTFVLERDPRIEYPDLEELANVRVMGMGGGACAWEGRLEDLPSTGGADEQINPQCNGWQGHLQDDNSAAMIFIDQNQTTWQGPSLNRQIELAQPNPGLGGDHFALGSSAVQADPTSHLPMLALIISDSWTTTLPITEAWYDAANSGLLRFVYYKVKFSPSMAGDISLQWSTKVLLSADDVANVSEETGQLYNVAAADQSGYFQAPSGTDYRYAILQQVFFGENAGQQGEQYTTDWTVAVYGSHGLPTYGPDPRGVMASDVIAYSVSRWAPQLNFTTGVNGTIQPSNFIIPQLAFTPTTVSQMIQTASQYELLDWMVWENKTFWLNARGSYSRARNWQARTGSAQLQQTGSQVSKLWNGVIVNWTSVDGKAWTVGPPGSGMNIEDQKLVDPDPLNPANEAGIKRWQTISMLGTSTQAGAIQVGALFLQEQKQLDAGGQATLIGHAMDENGVLWPAWMVRAGDTIQFVDAADPSPRRIVSTSYDDPQRSNTIQLDQPPDSLTALLQRLSVALVPYGLS